MPIQLPLDGEWLSYLIMKDVLERIAEGELTVDECVELAEGALEYDARVNSDGMTGEDSTDGG